MVELLLSSRLDDVLSSDGRPASTMLLPSNHTALSIARPVYIPYKSYPLRLLQRLALLPWLLVEWWTETVHLRIPLLHNHVEHGQAPYTYALVRIADPRVQVYHGHLVRSYNSNHSIVHLVLTDDTTIGRRQRPT